MAQMNKQRATFFTFVYKNTIWAMGGYSGPYFRTRKIEFYNPDNDCWQFADMRLDRGVEAGMIISLHPDEIIILGGNLQNGPTMTCHNYNLHLKRVHEIEWMSHPRVLQKGGIYNDVLYQLGGDKDSTVEKCELGKGILKWVPVVSEFSKMVNSKKTEQFSHSQFTVNVISNLNYQME